MTPRIVEILYQNDRVPVCHQRARVPPMPGPRHAAAIRRLACWEVSLNPIRHIDLFGTIVIPLIAAYRFPRVDRLGEAHTRRSQKFSPSCDG